MATATNYFARGNRLAHKRSSFAWAALAASSLVAILASTLSADAFVHRGATVAHGGVHHGGVAHAGVTRVGPNGGVYHRGATYAHGGGVHGGVYHGGGAYVHGGAWGVRPWVTRPYFGTVVAGVTLGTIVAATAYNVAPAPPASNLCWYWTDETRVNGYWSYCQ